MAKKMPEMEDYKYGFRDEHKSIFQSGKGLTQEIVVRNFRNEKRAAMDAGFPFEIIGAILQNANAYDGAATWMTWISMKSSTMLSHRRSKVKHGKRFLQKLRKPSISWVFLKRSRSFLLAFPRSMNPKLFTTACKKILKIKVLSSQIRIRRFVSIRSYSENISVQSFLQQTINLQHLNSAVWSGGSFIYVPKGVKCEVPLQAYFRINSENMGQFERTLIIADEESFVHYVEGCTAPIYSTNSLHSAVVEIVCMKNSRARYTTIQNWAPNIYNLVTKRAVAEENATMEWVDGNIGSKLTMKYPAVVLKGRGAKGMVLSIAVAGKGQHQDAGAKMTHLAPDTTSTIISKSISKHGGKVTYRGLASFGRNSEGSKANIKCDTLIMDNESTSDTIPYNEIMNDNITLEHEATVSKVSEDQLFYLMSRGLTDAEATQMIVMGFIEPFTKELPMEYAVEMNRLIKFEMEGSIG